MITPNLTLLIIVMDILKFLRGGKHWSFILPDQNGNVSRTTEKIRISNLCSDGLYYFKDKYIFESAFNNAVKKTMK